MYRRSRVMKRYRKRPQNVNQFQITNKVEAKSAWERLMSVNLLDPVQISAIWLQYTPREYYFRLTKTDLNLTNQIFFDFIDNVFTSIDKIGDVNFLSDTLEINQFFYRPDIHQGYDFVLKEFNGFNINITRHLLTDRNLMLAGDTEYLNVGDQNISFVDGVNGVCTISDVTYREYINNLIQPNNLHYTAIWNCMLVFHLEPSINRRYNYVSISGTAKYEDSDPNINEEWGYRFHYNLTPANYEGTVEETYEFDQYIKFMMFPKGYYNDYYLHPEISVKFNYNY